MRSGSGRIRIWSGSKIRSTDSAESFSSSSRLSGGRAFPARVLVDAVNEAQPLQRVHAGQLGPERAVGREQGADPSDLPALFIPRERVGSNQFQLHSALAFNYWTIRIYPCTEGQSKPATAASSLQLLGQRHFFPPLGA